MVHAAHSWFVQWVSPHQSGHVVATGSSSSNNPQLPWRGSHAASAATRRWRAAGIAGMVRVGRELRRGRAAIFWEVSGALDLLRAPKPGAARARVRRRRANYSTMEQSEPAVARAKRARRYGPGGSLPFHS